MTAENPLRARLDSYKARFDPDFRKTTDNLVAERPSVRFPTVGMIETRNGILSYKTIKVRKEIKAALEKAVRRTQ